MFLALYDISEEIKVDVWFLFKELYNSVYIIFDFLLSSQYTSCHILQKENNIKQFS